MSRAQVSPNALKVLYRLKTGGFSAFIVGGGVRDLLLNIKPKDFDIATNASPSEIRKLFKNCRLIGRRFRLAHIYFSNEIVEVATFRAKTGANHSEEGMIVRDNIYGTQEEDAWRRDFSVNSLYYNIKDFSIIDYTGGMKDLKEKKLRIIGDPVLRYQEDPVRILRALRLAVRLDFSIDKNTAAPIADMASLLKNVPSARLFDEIIKWFFSGNSLDVFKLYKKYNVFPTLFRQTDQTFSENKLAYNLISVAFSNTATRIKNGKLLNPAFLYAVFLWWPLQNKVDELQEKGMNLSSALHFASNSILKEQIELIAIPRRLTITIKEIWTLQYRFLQTNRKKIARTRNHPRFKIAYDFLLLRAESGEKLADQIKKWSAFLPPKE